MGNPPDVGRHVGSIRLTVRVVSRCDGPRAPSKRDLLDATMKKALRIRPVGDLEKEVFRMSEVIAIRVEHVALDFVSLNHGRLPCPLADGMSPDRARRRIGRRFARAASDTA